MSGRRGTWWRSLFVFAVGGAVSCGSAAPVTRPSGARSSAIAPEKDAFWVVPSAESLVGPAVDGGTWAIVGGRRLLLRPDGSTGVETDPTEEALHALAAVPLAGGAGGKKVQLLGASRHLVHAFDEPLGQGRVVATFERDIARIGAAPGLLFVWLDDDAAPRVLDALTLAPSSAWPSPVLDVAFLDAQRGAAIFVGGGLAVTADGGATFRPVEPREEATRMESVTHIAGVLRASTFRLRSWPARGGKVDVDAATVSSPLGEPNAPPELALGAREQWVLELRDSAMFDPLWLAVLRGVDLGGGAALVAAKGRLVKMDLSTGLAVDVDGASRPELALDACEGARTPDAAWFKCSTMVDGEPEYTLLRAPIARPAELTVALRGRSWGAMYTTSAGGLAISPCASMSEARASEPPGERSGACVLQPDGSFARVARESNAGAARDGALYGFSAPMAPAPDANQGLIRAYYPDGRSATVASVALPTPITRFESLDEDADGTLHLVLAAEDGLYAVRVKGAGEARSVHLPGTSVGAFRSGHGFASGPGGILTASGDGVDWRPAAGPSALILGRRIGSGGGVEVTSMGVDNEGMLRVHWGRPAPTVDVAPRTLEPTPARLPEPPARPVLHCKLGAPVGSAGMDDPALVSEPAPIAGEVREIHRSTGPAPALWLTEIATDERGAPPTGWQLRWLDAAEIGARERTWKGPARGSGWATGVHGVAARSGDVAFGIAYRGKKAVLVRIDPAGRIETRDTSVGLLPTTAIGFGEGERASLAWVAYDGVVVWPAGAEPRLIARLARTREMFAAGPTDTSVDVLVPWGEEMLRHTFALGASSTDVGATVAWTRGARPFTGPTFPPRCSKGATGPQFAWSGSALSTIAIQDKPYEVARSDVMMRSTPEGDCAERAFFEVFWSELRFLRVDLTTHTGEYGRADATTPAVSTVTCDGW